MIKEYALDPALLNSWERVRYYCEHFGWEKGRLISRFPKSWKKLVWECTQGTQPLERKRIEVYMARMDTRLLEQSRAYNGEQPWHQNVALGHHQKQFDGIITDMAIACGNSKISNEEFEEEHPLLQKEKHIEVVRTPESLVKILDPVLSHAKQVHLIDPYFDPQPDTNIRAPHFRATKWTTPLAAIILQVNESCIINYHTLRSTNRGTRIPSGADNSSDAEKWRKNCMEELPHVLPKGRAFTIHRWQEKPDGEDFHARYILTDKCALLVDPGLDASHSTANSTTKLTLLGEVDRVRILAKFTPPATNYTHLSELQVIGIGDCLPQVLP
jgi:hypothetical protein